MIYNCKINNLYKMIEFFLSPDVWVALLTLTFLEIVLGIDNIVFISIAANKLPEEDRKKATNWGLIGAMVQRIILLFFVSFLVGLKKPLFTIDWGWIHSEVSGQTLILFVGGLFLLYKSVHEIHAKVDEKADVSKDESVKKIHSLSGAITQIMIIDFIFSIDSILTAIGMTNGLSENPNYTLILMILAVIISIVIMMVFANPIRIFINEHPSMQILGLSFLILIGFMLITEAAHLSNTVVLGSHIGAIPKGYLYFSIAFSLFVEFVNMKIKKNK